MNMDIKQVINTLGVCEETLQLLIRIQPHQLDAYKAIKRNIKKIQKTISKLKEK